MRIGVFTFSTDRDLSPAELAKEVEARGLDALLFTEHSHIPTSRTTPYPDVYGGGVLPDFYMQPGQLLGQPRQHRLRRAAQRGVAVDLRALRQRVDARRRAAQARAAPGRHDLGADDRGELVLHCPLGQELLTGPMKKPRRSLHGTSSVSSAPPAAPLLRA
jgi:hypothetical protein